MNIERGKRIPTSHIAQQESAGCFTIIKSVSADSLEEENTWMVSIPKGTCTCPSYILSKIPWKHMFAVFCHYSD